MNYLDIIIIIPVLWFAYKGFSKGLVITVASLVALFLGVFGAIKFSNITSDYLIQYLDVEGKYLPIISFAITFILIVIAIHLLARLLDKLIKAVALGIFNRILGALFGVIKAAFIISVILVILNSLGQYINIISEEEKEKSVLYNPVSGFAPMVINEFKKLPGIDDKNTVPEKNEKNSKTTDI